MYSELDVHTETVTDPLMLALIKAAEESGSPMPTIEQHGLIGPGVTSVIVATSHDGRRFKIIVTTLEID